MTTPQNIQSYVSQIRRLSPDSHKGQNGKVLLVGGSELFHAASRWSLDVLSAMVDMVFYSSVPENNELIREAKGQFWDGVVVPRGEVKHYADEANVILIGPGMTRDEETAKLTNDLLSRYPSKKWVIDAGALQMVRPELLNEHCIVTPHKHEFIDLMQRAASATYDKLAYPTTVNGEPKQNIDLGWSRYTIGLPKNEADKSEWFWHEEDFKRQFDLWQTHRRFDSEEADWTQGKVEGMILLASLILAGATVLRKDEVDLVFQQDPKDFHDHRGRLVLVPGGNPGMTKGGTGDVLAGLVAGLYCFTDSPLAAAVVGSYVNKTAGDMLYAKVGPFFQTSELVQEIPVVLKELLY